MVGSQLARGQLTVGKFGKKHPGGQTPAEWAITCQRVQEDLRKNTEARNVPFNLADLKDPSQAAIPEDTLDISKVIKSAHFYFWAN